MSQAINVRTVVRIGVYLLLGAVGGYAIYAYERPKPVVAAGPQLKAGGSSVVYFIMDKWKQAYLKDKKVNIRYRSTGSSEGVKEVIDHNYDVGFTSSPLTEDQRAQAKSKGGDLVQIPAVLISVVPVYNLPQLQGKDKEGKQKPPLNFTADVLAKIFMGKIDKWNDPELQEINKGVTLPDLKIIVVRREDPSGTTFTFTNYLSGASELWRTKMGSPSNEVKWFDGAKFMARNHGVALFVKQAEGAIGYVELINAVATKLQYGAVQNKDKTAFVLAKPETMTAAAKAAQAASPNELPADLTNQAGKDSYPICAVDWAVCYQQQPAADYQLVSDFMNWIVKDGQECYARERQEYATGPQGKGKELQSVPLPAEYHAPLPAEFRQRAEEKLKTIKSL